MGICGRFSRQTSLRWTSLTDVSNRTLQPMSLTDVTGQCHLRTSMTNFNRRHHVSFQSCCRQQLVLHLDVRISRVHCVQLPPPPRLCRYSPAHTVMKDFRTHGKTQEKGEALGHSPCPRNMRSSVRGPQKGCQDAILGAMFGAGRIERLPFLVQEGCMAPQHFIVTPSSRGR